MKRPAFSDNHSRSVPIVPAIGSKGGLRRAHSVSIGTHSCCRATLDLFFRQLWLDFPQSLRAPLTERQRSFFCANIRLNTSKSMLKSPIVPGILQSLGVRPLTQRLTLLISVRVMDRVESRFAVLHPVEPHRQVT